MKSQESKGGRSIRRTGVVSRNVKFIFEPNDCYTEKWVKHADSTCTE